MAINFNETGAEMVGQGGVRKPAGDPRETQVAGLGQWQQLLKQVLRPADDLAEEATRRAAPPPPEQAGADVIFGTGAPPPQAQKPLITDALTQPNLLDENFDPNTVLQQLDTMPDPRIGAPTTPAGSPLSSDEGINFQWFDFGNESDPLKAIELIAEKLPPKGEVVWETTHAAAKKALAEELDILPDLLEGKLGLSAQHNCVENASG